VSKKKVLLQTDFSLAKTGFGRNARALLQSLYESNKYEVIHYCCGIPVGHPELSKTPWKSVGALPSNPQEAEQINKDPNLNIHSIFFSALFIFNLHFIFSKIFLIFLNVCI
jgi:hypothetical protein